MTSTPWKQAPISALVAQLSRFAVAGALNTLVGVSVIFCLDMWLGLPSAVANAAGYAVGIGLSWFLQRNFVFQTKSAGLAEGAKFLIATALSFGANQLVLLIALSLLGREPTMRALAQLTAIATYSTLQYALCKFWVFPVQQPALK